MSSFKSPRSVAAALVVLGAILTLGAASAGAAGTLVAYNLYPLVSDSSAVSAPLADASLVNGWGLSATATSPWWSSNNKTNTSTLYTGVGSKNATVVTVPGGPTGTVANPSTTDFAVSQNGVSGAVALPVRHARRPDPRLDADGQRDERRGRRRQLRGRRRVHGLATANDRLYAADFHNGRVDSFDASFKPLGASVRGSEAPQGLGAVRDPGARREHLRHLRPAGRDEEDRRAGRRQRLRRRVHAGRRARRAGRFEGQAERAAERAVGPRDGTGELRRLQRRPARRQLRQRPDQRLPAALADASGSTRARSGSRAARRSRSTASGRSRSATARRPARRTTCTSPPARPASARAVRLHRRRLTESLRADGGRRRLGRPPQHDGNSRVIERRNQCRVLAACDHPPWPITSRRSNRTSRPKLLSSTWPISANSCFWDKNRVGSAERDGDGFALVSKFAGKDVPLRYEVVTLSRRAWWCSRRSSRLHLPRHDHRRARRRRLASALRRTARVLPGARSRRSTR